MRRTSAWSTTDLVAALAVSLALVLSGRCGAGWRVAWETDGVPASSGLRAAVLADVDGDGAGEIVLACREGDAGALVCLAGDGGVRWERRTASAPLAVCADLEGDGGLEVVSAWRETVAVLSGRDGALLRSGAVAPVTDDGRSRSPSPVRAIRAIDCDGDGRREIVLVAGAGRGEHLAAYRCDTLGPLWSLRAAAEDGPFGRGFDHLAAGDANGDGVDEVLVTENMNRLVSVGARGSVEWTALLGEKSRFSPEGVASAPPVVADLTGDGAAEVAIGCFAGSLVVLEGSSGVELVRLRFGAESHRRLDGRRRLPAFLRRALESAGEPVGELTALDLDGRPGRELVFGCSDGLLYAVSAREARTLWSLETPGDVYDAPAAVGDSAAGRCLLAWTTQGVVACEPSTGEPRRLLDAAGGAASLLVGDLDGDGRAEIVLVGRRGRSITALTRGGGQ